MDQRALQDAINSAVTAELEKFHCSGGTLHCETRQSGDLLTLHGTKTDGKAILLWPDSNVLRTLAGRYLETTPQAAGFTLDVNLDTNTYQYTPISPAEIHARDAKEKKECEEAAVRERLDFKRQLQARSTPFGRDLAERVAQKLQTRSLYNSHRDYCGMGLDRAGTQYCYCEVEDGSLYPILTFRDREAFVDWLSKQSDASLGRLDEEKPWYWGNQTITRERLESF